jgi:hypothetical protein
MLIIIIVYFFQISPHTKETIIVGEIFNLDKLFVKWEFIFMLTLT